MEATHNPGKPSQRRYSPEEKAAAVRMVRTLRKELGTKNGTVKRVADQLGYGAESVRTWVKQAEIDDGENDKSIWPRCDGLSWPHPWSCFFGGSAASVSLRRGGARGFLTWRGLRSLFGWHGVGRSGCRC